VLSTMIEFLEWVILSVGITRTLPIVSSGLCVLRDGHSIERIEDVDQKEQVHYDTVRRRKLSPAVESC